VPAGVSVPTEVLALFKAAGLTMLPTLAENVLSGTEDIQQQAEEGNLKEVKNDAAKLLMRTVLKNTTLAPIPDAPNTYHLSYDNKLYPLDGIPNALISVLIGGADDVKDVLKNEKADVIFEFRAEETEADYDRVHSPIVDNAENQDESIKQSIDLVVNAYNEGKKV
jgi:hypothetical protein